MKMLPDFQDVADFSILKTIVFNSAGCGNGKYLHINRESVKMGCDYCLPLVDLARGHGHEVQVCDGLRLPYRDGCFDAILSIAGTFCFIHFLSLALLWQQQHNFSQWQPICSQARIFFRSQHNGDDTQVRVNDVDLANLPFQFCTHIQAAVLSVVSIGMANMSI